MQLLGRHDMLSDRLDQRRQQPGRLADPIGQRGAVEVDALAPIDARLPVERQMIAVLADQHMGQQPGPRPAALDRQGRHRRLRHALAAPAGKRRPDVPDHFEAAGNVVEDLADVLADLAHLAAAGRTGAGRLVNHLGAR
jgi:hypothetical protein